MCVPYIAGSIYDLGCNLLYDIFEADGWDTLSLFRNRKHRFTHICKNHAGNLLGLPCLPREDSRKSFLLAADASSAEDYCVKVLQDVKKLCFAGAFYSIEEVRLSLVFSPKII